MDVSYPVFFIEIPNNSLYQIYGQISTYFSFLASKYGILTYFNKIKINTLIFRR